MKGRIKKRVSFLLACSMMFGCFPNSSVAYAMETQTEMLAEETNTTTYELKVGETIKIEGEEIEIVSEENAENISCVKTAGWQKVLDQDTLEDGKYFIGTIINGGGSNYSGDAEAFLKLEGETPSLTKATSEWWEKSDFEIPYVWNVKRIEENKYTMQSQDNKYLHLHTNGVGMSDEEKYVDIASRFLNSDYRNDDCPDAQNVYVVTNGQVFLNYQGHTSGGVYAKTGKGIWSAWYLYRVKDIIEITAQKAGTVDIMIDEVPYTITVLDERPVLEALVAEVESENYKQENYTLSSWNTYVQALEEARNLLGDNSATYDVLYDARIALETARDGLTEKSKVLIPVDAITATGNQENNNQSASQVLDEEDSTIWHTQHSGIKSYDNLWIQFELDSTYEVYSLKYKPRSGAGNGTIKKYTVMTSDDGVNWNTVSEGFWTEDGTNTGSINDNEKEAIFKVPTCTKYVRLKAENAVSDNTNGYVFASAAKIRLYGIRVVDFTEVDKAIATAEALDRNLYTTESLIAVDQAMEAAKAADRKQEYTEEAQEATNALASAINAGLAALEVEELAFSGAYVSLHDDISVHYVFNKEVFEKAGYRDIEIDFEFNNKTIETAFPDDWTSLEDGRVEYEFVNIAPQHMNSKIKATITATYQGETVTASKEYSVVDYCKNMLEKYPNDTKLRTLIVDLLNYGSEAQKYLDSNVDPKDLANASLSEAEQEAWFGVSDFEYKAKIFDATPDVEPKVTWESVTLRLDNSIMIRYKIQADSVDDLKVKFVAVNEEGESVQTWEDVVDFISVGENQYYIYFDGLNAAQMKVLVQATVCNADGTAVSDTLQYSIESYAYAKHESQSVGNIVKAIVKYGRAAADYVKSFSNN